MVMVYCTKVYEAFTMYPFKFNTPMHPLIISLIFVTLLLSACSSAPSDITTISRDIDANSLTRPNDLATNSLVRPRDLPAAKVVAVIDGDTVDVEIDGRKERLRLIGIDTPESVDPRRPVECFGREAAAQSRTLLTGQTVYLEADPSQDESDRYGRLLRYVWLADGRMFNYEMIANGYAFEYTYRVPYAYQQQFQQAERNAREAERGLWSPRTCNGQSIPAAEAPATNGAISDSAAPVPTAALSVPLGSTAVNCNSAVDADSAPNSPIQIIALDKDAELVRLRNISSETVDLNGWTLCSLRGGQTHAGIDGTLAPGAERDFRHTGGSTIWSNSERDDAALYDAQGQLISYWPDRS